MTKVTLSRENLRYSETVNRLDALRRVLFLHKVPPDTLREIAAAGHERACVVGEEVFRERERCLGLIVVLSGAAWTFKTDSRGRQMVLGIERPGGSVGDLPLFDGGNYPYSAEASAEDTRLFIVRPEAFARLTETYPEIARGAVRALAIENRRLIEMLKAQALHTVRSRLAAYLLHAADDQASFSLPETNAAIGSRVGTVREVISRTLHALEDAGIVTLSGRTVTLLNLDKFRHIAQEEG